MFPRYDVLETTMYYRSAVTLEFAADLPDTAAEDPSSIDSTNEARNRYGTNVQLSDTWDRLPIKSEILALGLSSGSQLLPTPNYTLRWSSYEAPSYIVAVKPATEEDVAKIITYAVNSSIPFLSTGGGHGFAISLGQLNDGIEIDLSNFNNVSIDVKANTLTIGGAVRIRDVLGPLGQAHKELHSLLSVRMVTAAGKIITASTTENSELFWGIRGAGFNYGTMLEATYSVYDETAPLVLNADFLFAPNASQAILEYFKTFETGLPAKLSFLVLATYSPTMGGSVNIVNAVYAGSQAEGENQPANYTCPTGSTHNVYGSAVHRIDIEAFQAFYENYEHLYSSMPQELGGTVYFIEFFPKQAVEAVPSRATAYPGRNITVHIACKNSLLNFAYNATNSQLDRRINDFAHSARKNFSDASGFLKPQLYVSYGHGDEDLETLYSAENLPRLKSMKAAWDPENVYRYPLVSWHIKCRSGRERPPVMLYLLTISPQVVLRAQRPLTYLHQVFAAQRILCDAV
ncbi:MAG: hypothetical protein Q9196_005720 [Gyalolechia fulgens]